MEIARKARTLLRRRDGGGMFTPVIAVMLCMLFLAGLTHYIRVYSMVLGISDYTQEAVLQTATANSYNVFGGVREGNSSAHLYAGSGVWQELVSTAELYNRLEDMLQMTRGGNSLYMYDASGRLKYAISNIQIHCENVDVGANGNSVTLTFSTTVTAEIPITFLGVTNRVMMDISLKSYFTPRF